MEPGWWRFPQIVKLAAPTLAGYLREHGVADLSLHDFEVQGFDALRRDPQRFRFEQFFDDARVDRDLAAGEGGLLEQAEQILHLLEVREADLYALSCASVIGRFAEMHAVGNLCLCLAQVLKARQAGACLVVGGLQISPESKQREEYQRMLDRCGALDVAVIGRGELPLLHVAQGLRGEAPGFALPEGETLDIASTPSGRIYQWHSGAYVDPESGQRDADGRAGDSDFGSSSASALVSSAGGALLDERPEGAHRRARLNNPSVFVTPCFDAHSMDARASSSSALLERYHLGAHRQALGARDDDRILVAPMIFQEGCNASCAFCGYGMTRMVRREPKEVVRAIAGIQEAHDVHSFHFLNTNINGSYRYADAFMDELIAARLNIQWSDCANLRAVDERLLVKARESGAIRFTWGLEYPSDRLLKVIHKGIDVRRARERLQLAHDLGFWNQVLLITGLPGETDGDLKGFVDFLEGSAGIVDGYNVSPFYLISASLMGTYPERYGIELARNDSGLLEDAGFSEFDPDSPAGARRRIRSWEEKQRAIEASTLAVTRSIQGLKRDPKAYSGSIDLELLFLLYDRLGHERKAEIVRLFEEAHLGSPTHIATWRARLARLVEGGYAPVDEALAGTGWALEPEGLDLEGAVIRVPLRGGAHRLDVEIRDHALGVPHHLAGGESLGVRGRARPAFAEALEGLLDATGPLPGALAKAGWRLVGETEVLGDGTLRFRIEGLGPTGAADADGPAEALDLCVSPAGAGRQAAMEKADLGFSYQFVEGRGQPMSEPLTARFVMRLGAWLLDQLRVLPEALSTVPWLDDERARRVAASLVEGLEAPLAEDFAWERRARASAASAATAQSVENST